jgi:hypothetical protein
MGLIGLFFAKNYIKARCGSFGRLRTGFAPQQPGTPQKDCFGGKSPHRNDKPEQLP